MLFFRDHTIPDVSVSALSSDGVFYFHNNAINCYDASTEEHKIVHRMQNATSIHIVDSFLCALDGNLLTTIGLGACSSIHTVHLKDTPARIIVDRNLIGFLCGNTIEVFNPKTKRISVVHVPVRLRDLANIQDTSYVLTEDNKVLKCRNLFIAEQFTLPTDQGICVPRRILRLFAGADSIYVILDDSLWKYRVGQGNAVLQYRLNLPYSEHNAVMHDYLVSDRLVHLSTAPFLTIRDKVYGFSGAMALSLERIYFLEKDEDVQEVTECYEGPKAIPTAPAVSTIPVPSFIRDEKQKEQYRKNEAELRRLEAILDSINKMEIDRREAECLRLQDETRAKLQQLASREEEIEHRIKTLKERAEKIAFHGDAGRFYMKLGSLNDLLNKLPVGKFEKLAHKLRMQKVVLRNRLEGRKN